MTIQSELLEAVPKVSHGFGTFDEPIPSQFLSIWEKRRPVWKQVHGVQAVCVDSPEQICGEVDSLYSFAKELPIGVLTADCVPILMSRRDGLGIAAVHSGWRGTRSHALRSLWKDLTLQGEDPKNWVAAVGPAIGPCCYEVSQELANDFIQEFSDLDPSVVTPKKRFLDLAAINAAELQKLGLNEVDLIRICTRCSQSPRLSSYRRDGRGHQQYSMIVRKG
jgi:YfiH family protein